MPRNLIVCFDGTNNEFGRENTNVVRLTQALDRDPSRQRLYYDPGVGTLPEPGAWTALGKWISKVVGLAFGGGLLSKVGAAYAFLMDLWEPGDRVYVFGFSRGAYSARVLAALLHQFGLLARGNDNMVPYILRLFQALPDRAEGVGTARREYFKLCDGFRWTFARVVPEGGDERRFGVRFLGLWDTVSSIGWAWDPPTYPFTARNPSVEAIRHAVSIDERRWFFRQNRIHRATPGQDHQERWFPGVHSDVGGGYPEAEGGLWRPPFTWVLDEARAAGLAVDAGRLERVLNANAPPPRPWEERQHESLTPRWWPAEFFPKLQWRGRLGRRVPAVGLGRHRVVEDGALIDRCALMRLRDRPQSRPPNLSDRFVETVHALQEVPDWLPYQS